MALANWISAFATLVGLIAATCCWGSGLDSGVGGGVGSFVCTTDTEGANSRVLVSVRTTSLTSVGVNSSLT